MRRDLPPDHHVRAAPGRRFSRRSPCPVLPAALGATLALLSPSTLFAQAVRAAPEHRIAVSVDAHEGTWLAFDVSRDGHRIAFDLLGQLWLLPATGGRAYPLTDAIRDTAEDSDPAFAPDGRSVYFAGERRGRAGIWQVDVASALIRRLTTSPDWDDQPAPSPDGTRLAFVRAVAEVAGERTWHYSGLYLLDLAGGRPRRVPFGIGGRGSVRDPAWSPDGRSIYIVAPRTTLPATPVGGAVWRIDVATGSAVLVGDSGLVALAPAASPDGQRLAYFAADRSGRWQLLARELASGVVRKLTDERELTPRRARWSADGRALFYVAGGRIRRLVVGASNAVEVPFLARVAFSRAHPALPALHFPAPGSLQHARGQLGLALSPDGSRYAMLALGRLWVVPVGGTPRAVAMVPEGARDPDWAPSQDRVAYSVGSWGDEDVVVTEVATGRTYSLTSMPGREFLARWSPDGRWIALIREAHDSSDTDRLVILPSDSRAVTSLAGGKDLGPVELDEWAVGLATPRAPAWTPDSRALLLVPAPTGPFVREPFASLTPTRSELVPVDGPRRPLTHTPFDATAVRWIGAADIAFLSADRPWRVHLRLDAAAWDEPVPLGNDAAMYLSAARDGSILYVSGDGLRLRRPSGDVRRLAWPLTFTVPVSPPLAIRNARVLDGTGAPVSAPQDLVLRGGRIAARYAAGAYPVPAGAQVLDAAGGVVMPGLIDLHFHYNGPEQLRGLLYNGVTTLRDEGSDIATLASRAEGGAAGIWPGPRISFGAFQLYTDWPINNGLEQGLEPERDTGQLGRAVALLVAHGAEHMKIRTFRGWNGNVRLIDAAHRAGLRTTGHCIFPLALLAAGMDAKEHVGNTCGARFDAPWHDDVLGVLKAAGVAVDPTSIVYAWWQLWLDDRHLMRSPEVAPFTPALKLDGGFPAAERNPQYWVHQQGDAMLAQTRALHNAGILLGLGTDAPELPWAAHLEMQRLVQAGLTPLEAIRAGTLNSARILGHEEEMGTIAEGKLADILVLEPGADPTRDIRDTRRLRYVVLGGKVVDREGLKAPRR